MACPYFANKNVRMDDLGQDSNDGKTPLRYESYLSLSKILTAQHLKSAEGGVTPIHDEHLFIITHQAFELWFKQMLYEIDSARTIFNTDYLEERNMLVVISRMNRVVEIIKLLNSQFLILETMTSQDFFDFRDVLESGSGFQSLQFRLLENRLGLRAESRIRHNGENYIEAFTLDEQNVLYQSEKDKSLFDLVNSWLERTPGLEPGGFDFFTKFKFSVEAMLNEAEAFAQEKEDPLVRERELRENDKSKATFNTIFDEHSHDQLVKKGERRFSLKAIRGALMIFLYRDEPRFHLPFQLLQCLMDIDECLNKLRYGHACMVQRMIGSKIGSGESSGFQYLRSTCSERYKIFRDLMSLSSFLVPRDRIPPLNNLMKRSLSVNDWTTEFEMKVPVQPDADSGVLSSVSRMLRRVSSSSQGTSEDFISSYRRAGKPESTV